jgi:hypothetical protein
MEQINEATSEPLLGTGLHLGLPIFRLHDKRHLLYMAPEIPSIPHQSRLYIFEKDRQLREPDGPEPDEDEGEEGEEGEESEQESNESEEEESKVEGESNETEE